MAEGVLYPKMPESNWWTIRNQFKRTMPATVTISYLKTLLNLTSEKSANNLLSPLKQMGIIDDCKPTTRANDWRDDSKYKDTCNQIVQEIYPSELLDLNPGPNFDKESIKNWFMHTAKLGQGAAALVASVFIMLRSAELKTDFTKASTTKSGSKTYSSKKTKKQNQLKYQLKRGKKKIWCIQQ